jgi:hypothetical protein
MFVSTANTQTKTTATTVGTIVCSSAAMLLKYIWHESILRLHTNPLSRRASILVPILVFDRLTDPVSLSDLESRRIDNFMGSTLQAGTSWKPRNDVESSKSLSKASHNPLGPPPPPHRTATRLGGPESLLKSLSNLDRQSSSYSFRRRIPTFASKSIIHWGRWAVNLPPCGCCGG